MAGLTWATDSAIRAVTTVDHGNRPNVLFSFTWVYLWPGIPQENLNVPIKFNSNHLSLDISERGSPTRGLVLSAFIKSRHFIKQSPLLAFCPLHWKPRPDKTLQKGKRRIHPKPPHLDTIWSAQL